MPLTIAAVQPGCVPLDVAANAAEHARLVRIAGSRVVVFPELSITGYHFDAAALAPEDPRLVPIIEACAAAGSIALVGAPVRGEAGDHIGVLALDAEGARLVYRKQWLGGGELDRFVPGPTPAVLEVDGWRLGLAVCKDTGVEQHATDTAALGIDAYVAGVLDRADDPEVQAGRASRITAELGVWYVVASFAGSTGEGYERAAARSRVWSPTGELVAEAGVETGGVARATLTA